MIRLGCAVLGLLLLSPLFHGSGFGYDGVRLPAVLGLAAVLLALLAAGAVRRLPVPACLPWTLGAGIALLAVHLAARPASVSPEEGATAVWILAAGVAVLAFARGGGLPWPFVCEGVPWIVVGLSAAVSAIGIVQALAGGQAVGLEGNTNYSGTLVGMLLPFTAAVAAAGPLRRRVAAAAAGLLLVVALLLTASRGGLVAALAGTTVVGAVFLARRSWRAAAVPGVALALLVLLPLMFQRAAHFSERRAETGHIRFEIWKGAARLLKTNPWLGVGPGNFSVRYPNFRGELEARLSHRYVDQGFKEVEDAHSSWFQVGAETGVLGLMALLALAGLACWRWITAVRRGLDPGDLAGIVGAGGAIAAYLVGGLFNTLTLHMSHTVLFFAFAGLVERLSAPEGMSSPAARLATSVLSAAAAVAVAIGSWNAGLLAGAERAYLAAIRAEPAKRPAILERWTKRSPSSWRPRYALAGAYRRLGHVDEAIVEYREALKVRPYQAAVLNDLAVALLQSGAREEREEAVQLFEQADRFAPHCYLTSFNRGTMAEEERRFEEALVHYGKAVALKKNHASVHYRIGRIHLVLGRAEKAVRPLYEARVLGYDVGRSLRADVPTVVRDERFAEFFR